MKAADSFTERVPENWLLILFAGVWPPDQHLQLSLAWLSVSGLLTNSFMH
jgi:hypothetical protein